MSSAAGPADRLLCAAAQAPALLLVPALLAALVSHGEALLAAASALVAAAGLFAGVSMRSGLRRLVQPGSVLLSTSVLHAALLVLLLNAGEWAAREGAGYWGTTAVVVGLALGGGLSAPVMPKGMSSSSVNRLTVTLAVVLLLGHLVLAPPAGLLVTSAVLAAAAGPAAVMRLPEPAGPEEGGPPTGGS